MNSEGKNQKKEKINEDVNIVDEECVNTMDLRTDDLVLEEI